MLKSNIISIIYNSVMIRDKTQQWMTTIDRGLFYFYFSNSGRNVYVLISLPIYKLLNKWAIYSCINDLAHGQYLCTSD